MRRFLKYISIFSLSLIALASITEYMLRQVPNTYVYKRNLIEMHSKETKMLIIGSSVADCGIDPACLGDSTYNLAIGGEWFRFNQALLAKYIDDLPQIKNLIWGICIHSLWCDDNIKGDKRSVVSHNIYMDIGTDLNPLNHIELLSLGSLAMRKWSKYYLLHKPTMHCDSLGLDHAYDLSEKDSEWLEEIPDMAKHHKQMMTGDIRNKMYKENIQRMHEVAELCHSRGITLYLVVPPVHHEYLRLVDKKQLKMFHNAMNEVAMRWNNVHYLEYLNDMRFTDDDFNDAVHLTSDIGAQKFTNILKRDIDTLSIYPYSPKPSIEICSNH